MTALTVQAIAALCSIIAGDNPSLNTMDNLIQSKQVECHAYYANCLKDKKINECMSLRPAHLEKLNKELNDEILRKYRER